MAFAPILCTALLPATHFGASKPQVLHELLINGQTLLM